jgi:hypothetical protein
MASRDSYPITRKLEIIRWINNEGHEIPSIAAKRFKLPPGRVRTWWSSRGDFTELSLSDLKHRHLFGGGSLRVFIEFDDELSNIILSLRSSKQRVTRDTIRDLALTIAKREGISKKGLMGTNGWITRFIHINCFSFHRVINLSILSHEFF